MLKLIEKWRHSDVITVLEESIFPKRSSKKVLPWQQQGIHTQTFTFKQIPIYFQEKSPSLVELSFSVPELWAKNLKGGAEHPPPGQDRVKVAVRACYRAYFVSHVFKYLAPNFVSGRPAWCCSLEFLYNWVWNL